MTWTLIPQLRDRMTQMKLEPHKLGQYVCAHLLIPNTSSVVHSTVQAWFKQWYMLIINTISTTKKQKIWTPDYEMPKTAGSSKSLLLNDWNPTRYRNHSLQEVIFIVANQKRLWWNALLSVLEFIKSWCQGRELCWVDVNDVYCLDATLPHCAEHL